MTVLDFLTGGTFTTLKELIENIVQWVITFITNTTYNFFEPIINSSLANLPTFENITSTLQSVFNTFFPYIAFILDASFISKPILIYFIVSIIFRITLRSNSYITKLILSWYRILMP